MSYTTNNKIKNGTSVTLGASESNTILTGTPVKDAFYINPAFSRAICIDLVCTGVTVGSGITAKLQTRYNNSEAWVDSKTASITGNGVTSIRLLDTVSGDQTFLPLRCEGRVVVTTGTSSVATVTAVLVPALS